MKICLLITLLLLIIAYYPQNKSYAQETKPIINATLTGTVIDAVTKEPLQGVTIQLEAVTHQVTTDNKGIFQFVTGQKLPFTLNLSLVGYQSKQVVVSTSPTIIELTPRVESLEHVTVTSRRRKEILQDVPIPVTSLKGATLEDVTIADAVVKSSEATGTGVLVGCALDAVTISGVTT